MSQLTAEIEEAQRSRREEPRDARRRRRCCPLCYRKRCRPTGRYRSAGSSATARGSVADVRDVYRLPRRRDARFLKRLASQMGVRLTEGNDLTDAERSALAHLEQRAAYTVTTANTDEVVPVELKNEIIALIDNSTAIFSDVTRDTMRNQYELIRHKSIDKGDAAKTAEGVAPTDDEQNTFDRITLYRLRDQEARHAVPQDDDSGALTASGNYITREVKRPLRRCRKRHCV